MRLTSTICLSLALIAAAAPAVAAPGDILFSDDFNDASLAPWTTNNSARAGILTGGQTSGSNPRAAFTTAGPVTVTGPTFNAAVPAAEISFWLRRGSDAFSEDTDGGEDFVIEYRRADGSWGAIASYAGGGTNGQIYQDSFVLPGDALHGSLAIRFRQLAGSGPGFDFWHFDDAEVVEIAPSAGLGVGSCEDFEGGLNNFAVAAAGGQAGTSAATALSPTNSLFLNGGTVSVTSSIVDTSNPGFTDLTMWIRRGSDLFSEDPDTNENLVVEYRDDSGNWIQLESFSGSGTPGQIFSRSYNLPPAGRHAAFQVRYRLLQGSGPTFDFWHVDELCFDEVLLPSLQVAKLVQTLSDPVNGAVAPRAIPGAVVQYTVSVSNQGSGNVDADTLSISDPLPAGTSLFVDTTAGDPIGFTDGTTPSGLSFNYASDVVFSNQPGGGPPFDYTPVPDADGYDSAITGFDLTPSGTLNAASGGGNPGFSVVYRLRID